MKRFHTNRVFICIALIIITYVSEKNPCLVQFWPQGLYLSVVYDRESLRSEERGSGETSFSFYSPTVLCAPTTARVRVATALDFQGTWVWFQNPFASQRPHFLKGWRMVFASIRKHASNAIFLRAPAQIKKFALRAASSLESTTRE